MAQRAAEEAAAADRLQRHDAEQRLREVARRAGVTTGDSAAMVEALRQVEVHQEREIVQRQRDREDWAALVEILTGRSLADLEQELSRLERDLPPAGPSDSGTQELGAEPERRVRQLEHRHTTARGRLDRLLGQIDASERDLPDVAVAEEAEQQARRELERVETLERALDCTLGFLETARDRVQRDIAPRLGASVRERLSTVTAGRYEEVLVNPGDLEVQVRARGGNWHSATALSHGTTEQIYLLVRLALAEHLVTTGEPAPLVLDDVTVQSDATRTMAFLDILHGISGERQIILFSQEQEVVSWARAALDESRDRRIELAVAPFPVSGSQESLESR
jgi:DNA repair exonuclease SbcCD ATPase subunit